jgi:hypothetical protein
LAAVLVIFAFLGFDRELELGLESEFDLTVAGMRVGLVWGRLACIADVGDGDDKGDEDAGGGGCVCGVVAVMLVAVTAVVKVGWVLCFRRLWFGNGLRVGGV